jgi:hypothetical protein
MNTQGYGHYIQDLVQNWPADEPITTTGIATALAAACGIGTEHAKKVTNVNLKRLADDGRLTHIQKGIYGKVKETPFGRLTPSADEIISKLLLRNGDETIGYIAGPTLLNAIGLCSWLPGKRHIATNSYRQKIPTGTPIAIHKPLTKVDDENVPYLQTIEALAAMDEYPIDAENPDIILRGMLRNYQINNEKLILYARKYCGQKVLLRTIDVALGGLEN